MKIMKMASSERPREKMLLQGKEKLSNSELLAIIIKSGTKKSSALAVAEEVLNIGQNGLVDLMDVSIEELKCIEGIGVAKATELLAVTELSKRLASSYKTKNGAIESVQDVVGLLMEKMRHYKKEFFKTILLDSKGQIIMMDEISIGDLSSSVVHPRETFISAIKRSAASIILVHNHPSGNPEPSEADIKVTKRLIEAGELLGIKVLDHIIIGDGTYYSMKAEGII
ncbi:MAG: DNA repair protein RadC [Anaerovoracaceae bacterium]